MTINIPPIITTILYQVYCTTIYYNITAVVLYVVSELRRDCPSLSSRFNRLCSLLAIIIIIYFSITIIVAVRTSLLRRPES